MEQTALLEELRALRRALHQIPELGMEEVETAAFIRKKLEEYGIAYEECLPTGTAVFFPGRNKADCIAFRADIDALPVTEETGVSFQSRHPGKMHACGHDGHTAMLLGLAKYLSCHPEELAGDVLLLFQPAEEGPGGAKLMVETGILDKYHVKYIIGCHIFPDVPQGKVASRPGAMMARNGEVSITIHGTSAHGAMPQLGNDAVLAAGNVVTALHTILSRNVSPLDSGVLTFGTVHGGEACNIIADRVQLEGTMRAFSDAAYDTMTERVQMVAQGIAAGYGCSADVEFRHMYRVVDNDPFLVETLKDVSGSAFMEAKPYMLAEDFALFQQARPGLFFFLGAGNEEKGFTYPLHNHCFNFDESILLTGVETYIRLFKALQQKCEKQI